VCDIDDDDDRVADDWECVPRAFGEAKLSGRRKSWGGGDWKPVPVYCGLLAVFGSVTAPSTPTLTSWTLTRMGLATRT
jgi:hypothetical protein